MSSLFKAVDDGDVASVRRELDNGANVNHVESGFTGSQSHWRHDHSPLTLACLHGHSEAAAVLIERGADVNHTDRFGHTPLYLACKSHAKHSSHLADVVGKLLARGADANPTSDGYTALMGVALSGDASHVDVARLLIEGSADVHAVEEADGQSALNLSCIKGGGIATLLIDSGANVNHAIKRGETPLSKCCEIGHLEVATRLVARGADIHHVLTSGSNRGRTLLMLSCKNGHAEIARLLVDNEADVEPADDAGATALSLAEAGAASSEGHAACAELIRGRSVPRS